MTQNISLKITLMWIKWGTHLNQNSCIWCRVGCKNTHTLTHNYYRVWLHWIGPSNHQTQPIWGQQQPFLWRVDLYSCTHGAHMYSVGGGPISHVPHHRQPPPVQTESAARQQHLQHTPSQVGPWPATSCRIYIHNKSKSKSATLWRVLSNISAHSQFTKVHASLYSLHSKLITETWFLDLLFSSNSWFLSLWCSFFRFVPTMMLRGCWYWYSEDTVTRVTHAAGQRSEAQWGLDTRD